MKGVYEAWPVVGPRAQDGEPPDGTCLGHVRMDHLWPIVFHQLADGSQRPQVGDGADRTHERDALDRHIRVGELAFPSAWRARGHQSVERGLQPLGQQQGLAGRPTNVQSCD